MFRSRLSLLFLIGLVVGCEPAAEKTPAEGGRVSLGDRGATASFYTPGVALAADPIGATGVGETSELLTASGTCSLPVEPPAREYLDAGGFLTLVGPAGPIVLDTNGVGGYFATGFDPSLVVPDSEFDIEIPGAPNEGIGAATLHAALYVPQPVRLLEPEVSHPGRLRLTSGESVRVSWEPPFPPECVLVTTGCTAPPSTGGGISQSSIGQLMTEESSAILTASALPGGTCGLSVTRLSERQVRLTAEAYVVTVGRGTAGVRFSVH